MSNSGGCKVLWRASQSIVEGYHDICRGPGQNLRQLRLLG